MPEQKTRGALVFKGTDAVGYTDVLVGSANRARNPLGESVSIRHVRQIYVEKCDECSGVIRWCRWLPCARGVRGPGRPLYRRRFAFCALCAMKTYQAEQEAAREKTTFERWMYRHGSGVRLEGDARFH